MLILILSAIAICLASTLMLASSPLFLGLWIIFITLMLSMITNLLSTSWIGLMMMLIYIGGLLVMFAYFVALTPNLVIESKTMILNLTMSLPIFTFIMYMTLHSDQKTFSYTSSHPMTYLFMEHMSIISFLALILFFALVATVKMVSNSSSPLRPFN